MTVLYETPELSEQAVDGVPFNLISILGYSELDNNEKVEDSQTKSRGITTNLILIPSYRFDLPSDASVSVNGILMGDHQHFGEYQSKEILFKQVGFEWKLKNRWFGEMTLGGGTNEAGTRDVPQTTSVRDSLSDDYKLATRENYSFFKSMVSLENGTFWEWQL